MSVAVTADVHVPGLDLKEVHHHRLADNLRFTYDVLAWLQALVRELRGPSGLKLAFNAPEHWRFGPLLDDWPNGLARSIRHVLKRWHHKDRTSHLVHLQEHVRTLRVLRLLDEAMENDTLPSTLRSTLSEIRKGLRFSASAPKQWIINPALNTKQREQHLTLLPTWWRGLSRWIEVSIDHTREVPVRLHESDEIEERICVRLLNELIAAAERSAELKKFHRFARAWPPMPVDADSLTTDEFLDLISRKLLTVSQSHRGYLFETALEAAGVTSAAA